ncbi:hypothetical protein [Sphingomicrobium aestuariivivum]|uniref:hypothetical protein n=1 Tax=Sphingomicrobium aestuariivivum TaxID=1582356 RepID=UPI001FD67873|nr:hypothetical protein [Sphingomicrobium aestuariivivum]MCJ8190586.1 hypothetical protein [Sphingomicrobium aestuariivivum]
MTKRTIPMSQLREQKELNDTGEGMPLSLGSGGYGGTAETVEPDVEDVNEEEE